MNSPSNQVLQAMTPDSVSSQRRRRSLLPEAAHALTPAESSDAKLEYLRQHVLYSPGMDAAGRRILVMALCNLVHPTIISLDFLYHQVKALLNTFDNQEYVLVLLNPPPNAPDVLNYAPGILWLINAHNGLPGTIKKNLKLVYIVGHTGWKFNTILGIFLTFSSPKLRRKIHYIPTLATLPTYDNPPPTHNHGTQDPLTLPAALPLPALRIPPSILSYNHSLDPSWLTSTLPPSVASSLLQSVAPVWQLPVSSEFGTPPHLLPTPIPRAIAIAARVVANGRQTQGLFRRTPLHGDVLLVKDRLDADLAAASSSSSAWPPNAAREWALLTKNVAMPDHTLLVATSLLTKWVRDLPTAILDDAKLGTLLARSHSPENWPPIVFPAADPPHLRLTMAVVARVLCLVAAESEKNMMTPENLSRVWAGNIVRTADPVRDMHVAADTSSVVHVLIQQWCSQAGWDRWFGEFREEVDRVVGS